MKFQILYMSLFRYDHSDCCPDYFDVCEGPIVRGPEEGPKEGSYDGVNDTVYAIPLQEDPNQGIRELINSYFILRSTPGT